MEEPGHEAAGRSSSLIDAWADLHFGIRATLQAASSAWISGVAAMPGIRALSTLL